MHRLVLVSVAALAAAGVALPRSVLAQPLTARPVGPVSSIQLQTQIDMMRAQLEMTRQQQMGVNAQLDALDAAQRTERNLALLRAQANPGSAPVTLPGGAPAEVGQYASMPDAMLADSDAKVRAAAHNHH